ncbi:MAG TPA: hypothetical protein VFS59_03325 [Gemmatimonadaceae bacterium]|nr:hypothetical protein [Gemmatimonadaceae bacterium]
MKLQRLWTGSPPNLAPVVGPHPASDPITRMSELAHAFDRAQQETGCIERSDASTGGCAELAGAVRALVVAGRADGSPPERVLAVIKSATRPYFVDGVDEVHGDRLQTLILRQFIASYYDLTLPDLRMPRASE